MISNINFTNFLKYTVGNNSFYNIIEAVEHSAKTFEEIQFELNYRFIKEYNWTVEPEQDIFFYLDAHAKILNEKYENIIIMYSGGTDSHTILETFIRCGIKNIKLQSLDHNILLNSPTRNSFDQQLEHSLKKYESKFKELNYSLTGFEKSEHFEWNSIKDFENVIDIVKPVNFRNLTTPNSNYRLQTIKNDKLRFIDQNNTCVIWGMEKPKLIIRNGWWCWQMNCEDFFYVDFDSAQPYDNIFFFITDAVPQLHIKLAWLKARALEEIVSKDFNFGINEQLVKQLQRSNSNYYTFINRAMGYRGINYLLDSNLFKPGGIVHQFVYEDLYKNMQATHVRDLIKEYEKDIDSKYRNRVAGIDSVAIPFKPVTLTQSS